MQSPHIGNTAEGCAVPRYQPDLESSEPVKTCLGKINNRKNNFHNFQPDSPTQVKLDLLQASFRPIFSQAACKASKLLHPRFIHSCLNPYLLCSTVHGVQDSEATVRHQECGLVILGSWSPALFPHRCSVLDPA